MLITPINAVDSQVHRLGWIAAQDGHQNVTRLIRDYVSATNTFSDLGEVLVGAYDAGKLVGIGGLNIDPYEPEALVGRIRRLFVTPSHRRKGVGVCLMGSIETHAKTHFTRVQLFTSSPNAGRFYEKLGYQPVKNRHKVSHEKYFTA